jgi:hypothetical protein
MCVSFFDLNDSLCCFVGSGHFGILGLSETLRPVANAKNGMENKKNLPNLLNLF